MRIYAGEPISPFYAREARQVLWRWACPFPRGYAIMLTVAVHPVRLRPFDGNVQREAPSRLHLAGHGSPARVVRAGEPTNDSSPGAIESADNPEPRLACVLLLDSSQAMAGPRLEHLNPALKTFWSQLARDHLAARRIELAVVAFGGSVQVVRELTTVDTLDLPILRASGSPCLVDGLEKAVALLETRCSVYKECGIPYHRPWIFTVTASPPDRDVERVTRLLRTKEESKHLACFAVAVADLDLTGLRAILKREPLQLEGLEFQKLFSWLSASLRTAAYAEIFDAPVPLPAIDWQKKG